MTGRERARIMPLSGSLPDWCSIVPKWEMTARAKPFIRRIRTSLWKGHNTSTRGHPSSATNSGVSGSRGQRDGRIRRTDLPDTIGILRRSSPRLPRLHRHQDCRPVGFRCDRRSRCFRSLSQFSEIKIHAAAAVYVLSKFGSARLERLDCISILKLTAEYFAAFHSWTAFYYEHIVSF